MEPLPEERPPEGSLSAAAPTTRVVNRQRVAVFTVDGRRYAIGDRCPHRGGPLSRGRVEEVPGTGPAVRCPIHGWLFDLATGRCLNQPDASIATYDARA